MLQVHKGIQKNSLGVHVSVVGVSDLCSNGASFYLTELELLCFPLNQDF